MKCSELMRLLKRDGWYVVRQKGSHVLLEHAIKKGQLVVPDHGSSELATGTEKAILKKAGLTPKR